MLPPARLALVAALVALGALAPARDARAADKDTPTRGLRFPSLSPDGKTVVFAWRGDIWRAPTAGGAATRLTIHEAQDTKPKVSPDGKWIVFSSRRTGNYDVFVMPFEGGEPRQLTFHSGSDIATDWSPDGKRVLFLSSREPGPNGTDLYEVPVEGGTPRRVTQDAGRDGTYSPDGRSVVYVRGFNTVMQDHYKGSANFDVYVQDLAGGPPRRLTSTPWNELNPAFSEDGKTVWFLAESRGVFNFWSVPAAGGEPRPVTAWTDESARRATLSWDRRTAAFEKDGRLYTVDLLASEPKAVLIPVVVESDVRNSGLDLRTITDGAEHVSVSPDGSVIAVSVRGDLWLLPATGGEARRLTSGPAQDDWPRFSPDGRRLLYYGDARGNEDVYLLDLGTKESRPLTTNPADDAFPAWAPDGKHVVFTSKRTGNKDLFLLDLESGEERQLTRDPKDDDDATFSPDGTSIAFDSARGGSQAIWVMPAAAGEAQARRVTTGPGFFQVPSFSPDGSMIAFEEVDPASAAPGGLWVVKTSGGAAIQVSRDGQAACWSPRGDWIYFSAEREGDKSVYRVRAPQSIEVGERVPFLGRVAVDRRREFGELFDEAWHKLKDGFYDAGMHGVDWARLKDKYRPLAVDAEIKDEFYNVVSQMLAELNASHLGIAGPREEEEGGARGPATGYLGLDLDGGDAGQGRKVVAVQPKGPADEAGLRAGDVVKSVAGTALEARTDLDRLLAGTAGKEVSVTFVKADGTGERTVPVKATTEGALNRLVYDLWVDRCRKTVVEKSGGTAGYVHLNQMDQANLARFDAVLSELNQNRKVKGLVLDVRNNGGGNIHPALLDALGNRPYIQFQPRGQARQTQPSLYWAKPVVLLINERSFSDAEVFPYAFEQLRLGKVVGMPTAGGVIGTVDVTLADGSRFRIPRVGWYGLNGQNLEHLGVKPDVLVEETVEDRLAGRDPQLEKAVEVLVAEMRASGEAAPERKPEEAEPAAGAPPRAQGAKASSEGAKAAPPAPAAKTAEGAAAAEAVPPLYDAKVGEWVKMRLVGRDGREVVTVTSVAEVADDKVVVVVRSEGPAASREVRREEPRARGLRFEEERTAPDARETITLGGRSLDCLVVTLKTRRGATERRWYTNDLPVFGLARREVDGKVVAEAVEWGSAPGK